MVSPIFKILYLRSGERADDYNSDSLSSSSSMLELLASSSLFSESSGAPEFSLLSSLS
jgi:hypothetical protein